MRIRPELRKTQGTYSGENKHLLNERVFKEMSRSALLRRATREASPAPNTLAGVDGSLTACPGKVWWERERGARGAVGEVGGRKQICWSGGHHANTGAAHLRSKNTLILILVLISLE